MVFAMSAEPPTIDQAQLTGIICERPQNFAWFLGAGAYLLRDLDDAFYRDLDAANCRAAKVEGLVPDAERRAS